MQGLDGLTRAEIMFLKPCADRSSYGQSELIYPIRHFDQQAAENVRLPLAQ